MKRLRWTLIALVMAALLVSAYRIVEQRNRSFFGQDPSASSSMPMH